MDTAFNPAVTARFAWTARTASLMKRNLWIGFIGIVEKILSGFSPDNPDVSFGNVAGPLLSDIKILKHLIRALTAGAVKS
jgi:hypothetical protein